MEDVQLDELYHYVSTGWPSIRIGTAIYLANEVFAKAELLQNSKYVKKKEKQSFYNKPNLYYGQILNRRYFKSYDITL